MADAQALPGSCVICAKSTSLQCQGCKKAQGQDAPFYCGKEHQIAHWKGGHKINCGAASKDDNGSGWEEICGDKIDKNINNGLPYYVATQDLKAGHKIFVKTPLLIIPSIPTDLDTRQLFLTGFQRLAETGKYYNWGPDERKMWTCFCCHKLMIYGLNINENMKPTYRCKCLKCGWPVHTSPLQGQPPTKCELMHEAECKILVSSGQTWDKLDPSLKILSQEQLNVDQALVNFIALLRALLLPPELKKKLLKLPIFIEDLVFDSPSVKFIQKCLEMSSHCNIGEPEEVKTILKIILSNKTRPPRYYDFANKRVHTLILQDGPTGRILSNNCKPNCEMYVDPDTFKATFKTVRPVSKGDVLTLNYVSDGFYKSIHERLIELVGLFIPFCKCPRCNLDPTEADTYLSAIKCLPKNKKGCLKPACTEVKAHHYLLPFPKKPEAGLKYSDCYEWRTYCEHCKRYKESIVMKTQAQVTNFCNGIRLQLERASGAQDYEGVKKVITDNAGITLHPNHAMLFYAAINLSMTAVNILKRWESYSVPDSDHAKFTLHRKFLKDMDETLNFYEMVQPGRWEATGVLLFYRTMLRISELAEQIEKSLRQDIQVWDEKLKEINKDLKEALIILKNNTTHIPYHITGEIQICIIYSNRLKHVFRKKHLVEVVPRLRDFCESIINLPKIGDPNSLEIVKEENLGRNAARTGVYN